MNIYQYTAINNPNGSREVVESFGIQADRRQLAKQLAMVVAKHGNEALSLMASVHPDFSLFQKQIDDFKEKIKSDCKGSSSDKELFSNADGQQIKNEISSLKDSVNSPKEDSKGKNDLLIIGAILVIGLAIIYKQK